jgi:hypothetical protein
MKEQRDFSSDKEGDIIKERRENELPKAAVFAVDKQYDSNWDEKSNENDEKHSKES